MKRILSWLLIAAILLTLSVSITVAENIGELLITSDPETVTGAVGDIVKVNFYLYPNLPDDRLFDSIQGALIYDAEMLTLGSINLKDESQNLISLMSSPKSKSPMWMPYEKEKGTVNFAYIDAYGTAEQGFWFQAEFRIEKEGASAFVFNGIRYSGIDQTRKPMEFYIDPVQVGGVATEGQEVPTDAVADVTYAPLTPAVEETQQPVTPSPTPHNEGQTVPVTTTLPQPSGLPSSPVNTEIPQTPKPANTSTPAETKEATSTEIPTSGSATGAPVNTDQPSGTTQPTDNQKTETPSQGNHSPAASSKPADTQNPQNSTPAPVDTKQPGADGTDAVGNTVTEGPLDTVDPVAEATPDDIKGVITEEQTLEPNEPEPDQKQQTPNTALTIAVIAGMAVVILLAVLAIVLILIRKKRNDALNDDE